MLPSEKCSWRIWPQPPKSSAVKRLGTPEEIYENPATPFVMSFIGAVNVLSPDDTWKAHHLNVPNHASQVFLRPHDIDIFSAPADGTLPATINYIIHLGWTIRLELSLENGQQITAHINREQYKSLDILQGQTIYLRAKLIRSFEESPDYSRSIA